jgi:hypothetical protein
VIPSCSQAGCTKARTPVPHTEHEDDRGRRWTVIDHVVVAPAPGDETRRIVLDLVDRLIARHRGAA